MLLSRFHAFIARCTETERQLLLLPPTCQKKVVTTKRTSSVCICDRNSKRDRRAREPEKSRSSSFSKLLLSSLQSLSSTSLVDHYPAIGLQITDRSSNSPQWIISDSPTPSPTNFESIGAPYPILEVTTPSPTCSLDTCLSAIPIISGLSVVAPTVSFGVLSEAQTFFERKLGSRSSHAKYLVRAVRGFMEAMNLDPQSYKNIWSARTKIFLGSGKGPIARFHRLYDGLVRIKRGREDYDCASRLCHILLEHDLEQLLKSGSFQMSRGRGKKTAALSAQAASISTTVAAVKADRKAGRCYLKLLMEGSPGLLLLIGGHVNTV